MAAEVERKWADPQADSGRGSANDLRGRRVTVAGLGLFGGGLATVRFLHQSGARITVTDLRNADVLESVLAELRPLGVRTVLGRHELEDFVGSDLIVANPAVPPASPFLTAAREAGVPITSEVALFLARCPARVVAVTGTQGKSSTCQFIAQLAARAGLRTHLGGNIGAPLLDRLGDITEQDLVVLELSSYQLEALPDLLPDPSSDPRVSLVAVTKVSADHLERHGTPAAYYAAKARILELLGPGGCAILPCDWSAGAPPSVSVLQHGENGGLRIEEDSFMLASQHDGHADTCAQGPVLLGRVSQLTLLGGFQKENALLALGAAHLLGIPAPVLSRSLPDLQGPPHRMEALGEFHGRRVVDNGVSTTPESTAAVLADVEAGATLLCGGQAKRDLPFDQLVREAADRSLRMVTFGASGSQLRDEFEAGGLEASFFEDFDGAVRQALEITPAGKTLLFSPACASFDAFANFQARAMRFRELLTSGGISGEHRPVKQGESEQSFDTAGTQSRI